MLSGFRPTVSGPSQVPRWYASFVFAVVCGSNISSCVPMGGAGAPPGKTAISLWRHETRDEELKASLDAISRFNASQSTWHVDYETLPQAGYTEAVTAAALAHQLPCILEVDQPVVPSLAWTGQLRDLSELLPPDNLTEINDGARGVFRDRIYSIGQFDVSLAIFARKSVLEENGFRTATVDEPYTPDEFLEMLRILKRKDPSRFPFDINSWMLGEWLSYGFGPWLQSAGADLIDRSDYVRADGILNGPAAIRVAKWYARLHEEGLVQKRSLDDQSFYRGKSDFHYSGSWVAKRYDRRFGDDLLILPPVDFGQGPKVGAGSWQWSITQSCRHPAGAAAFIEFLLKPQEVAALSEAAGFVPVSDAAAELTDKYRTGGEWRLFYEFSKRFSVRRPETPAYPKISSAFEKAMLDIRFGKRVSEALDDAVDSIEYDIIRNDGYGLPLSSRRTEPEEPSGFQIRHRMSP